MNKSEKVDKLMHSFISDAKADLKEVLEDAVADSDLSVDVEGIGDPEVSYHEIEDDDHYDAWRVEYKFEVESDDRTIPVTLEYDVLDQELWFPEDRYLVHLAEKVAKDLKGEGVSATTVLHRRKITAAEEDEEAGFVDVVEDEDDGGISDAIDDLSDQVEDVQDTVDDIEEDDIDIDIDNNISDHYIAECDGCHGVFISAMLEADQEVDHISGICPLCQKETDQYLKWVVKAVERQ